MVEEEGTAPVEAKPGEVRAATAPKRRRKKAPSCQTCFFGCRGLCALELGRACATYRPDGPEGLAPPRQPALLYRDADESALAT